MGNSIGGSRKKTKVMKIDGETIKLKSPIRACEVVKDYPGFVLLDAEAVKHFGVRAKPLEPQQQLRPKKIYFLVELPKFPDEEKVTRRVRSGIHMSAKDRLECLMLSRRTVSDLTTGAAAGTGTGTGTAGADQMMRVKMRLPRAQVEKLMEESGDDGGKEVAEKIVDLYMKKSGGEILPEDEWKGGHDDRRETFKSRREKRVSFVPKEGEIHLNEESRKQSTE